MSAERSLADYQEEVIEKEIVLEEKKLKNQPNTQKSKISGTSQETKADILARKQRDIGVAEFFSRNRHLLGFDNKRKALMTTIKEAVDNALDACEEAGVLPEINVEIVDMGNDRFRVTIEDNGPGIIKAQIPKIFAKLLYGSKFHSLKQSRGQQGIGISAAVMYGQLTTGRSARIISKIGRDKPAHYIELKLDTAKNKPEILKYEEKTWSKDHGTKITIDLEASYQKGGQSIDAYLKETAIANPHVTIVYVNPKAEQHIFPRAMNELPKEAKEIKPHPHGIELGVLIKMLKTTGAKTLQQFFTSEFTRVTAKVVKEICEHARIEPRKKPKLISRDDAEKLIKAIAEVKIMNPPTDCISPIGEIELEKGLRKEVNAEFYAATTRPPSVYRGNPFQIEVALAYGGNQPGDKTISLMRYANKVPLLFQQGACGFTKAVVQTSWRSYGLNQSQKSLPVGPMTLVLHIASVWVPFTSESKEALAQYPEILKEIRLAIQEVGRKLARYTSKKRRVKDEFQKRNYIEKYIPHLANAIKDLIDLSGEQEAKLETELKSLLEQERGKIAKMVFDEKANTDFDEKLAKKFNDDEGSDE
jgi:DNA topoisomerase-6 subunit B